MMKNVDLLRAKFFYRQSNHDINVFMQGRNWTNYDKLESFYVEKLIKTVSKHKITPMGKV